MTNEIVKKSFVFNSTQIRTAIIDGEPWFVAKDVAETLGYTNPNKAVGDHCKGVTKRYPLRTAGGVQQSLMVSLGSSRKMSAKYLESPIQETQWQI